MSTMHWEEGGILLDFGKYLILSQIWSAGFLLLRRMLREGEERKEEIRRKRPDPLSSYFRSQTGFLLFGGRMPP